MIWFKISLKFVLEGPFDKLSNVIIDSGIGLALNRWQAIARINDDEVL